MYITRLLLVFTLITIVFLITLIMNVVPNIQPILWGIRILIGIIPVFLVLFGALIFWKFYPLTNENMLENKAKLKELGF